MTFRNELTELIDPVARQAAADAAAAAAGAQETADAKLDVFRDEMGGEFVELATTGGLVGRLEVGSESPGAVTRLFSPPRSGGERSSIHLTGTEAPSLYGDDGISLWSAGAIDLNSRAGSPVRVNGWTLVVARQRVWTAVRTGNPSDPIGTALTTLVALGIGGAPPGDWAFDFRCVISNSAAAAGFQSMTVNSVSVGDGAPRADCPVAGGRFTFSESWGYVHGGGDMTIRGAYQAAAGAGTVWSQGTQLVATFLGPRG